jgi:uncharacterized protein DUF6476
MRALQVLVVVMGVVIVVTTGVVIAVILGRLSQHAAVAPNRFAAQPIAIPHGARVAALTATGDRLIVSLTLADGGQRIIVLDLKTGATLGAIDLRPAP